MFLIIGNILSFIAALFTLASCWTKKRDNVFYFQFVECSVLAVASYFFGAYAGITTLAISAVRNLTVAREKYTFPVMIVFTALVVIAGVAANNRGFIGLIPVIATVQYTVCSYTIKGIKGTKYSIAANVFMWFVYSFAIFDISTGVMGVINFICVIVSLIKMNNDEKALARSIAGGKI
ncbi:MAG: YgjV family protein [Clostridia bacterium]|jgi:hypothetical protein|nr:YgjV family protein [Clostridia bacterium]